MPLSTSDVVDAYRADLSNAAKSEFSDRDATWLAFGTVLQRAVSLQGVDRAAYLRSASEAVTGASQTIGLKEPLALLARDGSSPDALCAVVLGLASEAEEGGAYALATAMLDFARILIGVENVRLQGRLLGQQARILRKIGEDDLSHELLNQVEELGTTHGDGELVARAHLGKGILARIRGNYPDARREFQAVLEAPTSDDAMRELHMHAHHGLLIVAATARDFDAALRHGALALAEAATDQSRIELMANLATVCFDAGQFRSALNGHLQVLATTHLERLRISAFGGAAAAAARLDDEAMVNALVAAAIPLLARRGPAYELADMAREFAEAYAYLGDVEQWQRYREMSLERGKRGKFFEIVHRIESMRTPRRQTPPSAVSLTGDALAVASRLASGDSRELLAAVVSTAR
jgi:hypothetical protein